MINALRNLNANLKYMLKSVLTYKHSKAVLKPLLLVIFCWCGFAVKAQIKTAATFSTFSSEPVVFGTDVKGGHHQVTSEAVRDAIPEAKREWGMFCTTYEGTMKTYQLVKGESSTSITDNGNWKEFVNAGSGVVDGTETKVEGNTNISVTGVGSAGDPYKISLVGNDTDGYEITNLKEPTDPSDAATKNYVDEILGGRAVYYGSFSSPSYDSSLTEDNTKKNGVYNISVTTASNGEYFVFVAPAAWRNPKLTIEGDDTLNVLVPMENIELNSNDYTVWSTNVTIPTGKELVIK